MPDKPSENPNLPMERSIWQLTEEERRFVAETVKPHSGMDPMVKQREQDADLEAGGMLGELTKARIRTHTLALECIELIQEKTGRQSGQAVQDVACQMLAIVKQAFVLAETRK